MRKMAVVFMMMLSDHCALQPAVRFPARFDSRPQFYLAVAINEAGGNSDGELQEL